MVLISENSQLPFHIIEGIINKASDGTCKQFCKNKLICKEINKFGNKFQFKLDGSDDADEFFEYIAGKYTLGQLKNPASKDEIAFVKQYDDFFAMVLKKEQQFFDTIPVRKGPGAKAKWIKLWVYRFILYRFVRNTIEVDMEARIKTLLTDSDSLHDVKAKMHHSLQFHNYLFL
jgi:hypothetical protein